MISLETYKLVHILGALLTFAALGGLTLTVANGATKQSSGVRRLIAITHGVATFLILLGGFGALARLGIVGGLPGWIYVKLVVWLLVAVLVVVPYRRPDLARTLFWVLPVLGTVAVSMALWKPF
ncbi:MAG: hypothetical protein MUC69_06945 [Gemmatimonadales bacterium]|jgi:hypothetical protein|nr:hypothetical protein [Gemmatimonadales bacterium]